MLCFTIQNYLVSFRPRIGSEYHRHIDCCFSFLTGHSLAPYIVFHQTFLISLILVSSFSRKIARFILERNGESEIKIIKWSCLDFLLCFRQVDGTIENKVNTLSIISSDQWRKMGTQAKNDFNNLSKCNV